MSQIAPDKTLPQTVARHLRSAVSAECYQTWFKDLVVARGSGDTVVVSAPNRYVKVWLESHYMKELAAAVSAGFPGATDVHLVVESSGIPAPDSHSKLGGVLDAAFASMPAPLAHASSPTPAPDAPRASTGLALKHRLDTFTVGKGNRLAFAAAQNVVEAPGKVYNPLYIHGGHGVGKTHLLQGIGHGILGSAPGLKLTSTSCEEFTNAYVTAVQAKKVDAFRQRFRTCDALLIDDVQFLAGREKTQEELLHTFDVLRQAGKQVVLVADAAPREIKRLDPKLVARFQSGLVARVDFPDLELRTTLILEKARERGLILADEVARLMASHIEKSVPEFKGAVCKLMALAAADNHPADRDLAVIALRELGYLRSGPVTLPDILAAVTQRFDATADDVRSAKRNAAVVYVRHVGMYLSKMLTQQSVAEIGRFYGNRDHATVLHACRKIADLLRRDESLRQDVQMLKQILGR